jgi:hypothetical protein
VSDTIYVVCGSVGEYSDHTEWMVAWYSDESAAKAHADAAQAEAEQLTSAKTDRYDATSTPLDPFRQRDYCGEWATYCVATIERGKWPFDLPPKGASS